MFVQGTRSKQIGLEYQTNDGLQRVDINQSASNINPAGDSPKGNGKIYRSPAVAVADIWDGATVSISGFAGCDWPERLIKALVEQGSKNLTVVCQGEWSAPGDKGNIQSLVASGQIIKLISPMPFRSARADPRQSGEVEARWKSGELELEVVPQGVLAERLRSGGAGLGGVFLPTGASTRFGKGVEVRDFGGRDHVFQPGLKTDFALLRAQAGDTLGNLVYSGTQRNWNPVMAMAAAVSIAEVDEIYQAGELDGELIVTPGIFVKRIVKSN